MDQRWLSVDGERPGLQKRVLESSWLQDAISTIDSTAYGPDSEPKESVDQDTGTYTPGPLFHMSYLTKKSCALCVRIKHVPRAHCTAHLWFLSADSRILPVPSRTNGLISAIITL